MHGGRAPFFKTYGIDIINGRDFEDGDLAGAGSAVVDQTTARKLFGVEPAVGRMVKLGGLDSPIPWVPIIGVARDHVLGFDSHPELGRDPSATVYFSQRVRDRYMYGGTSASLSLNFTVRSGPDVEKTRLPVLNVLAPLTPSNGRAYVLPQESFQNQLKTEEFLGLVGVLAVGVAVLLTAALPMTRPSALTHPYVGPPQSIGCGDCDECAGGHVFYEDTDYAHPRGGFNHNCYPISCVEGPCGATDDASAQVNTLAADEQKLLARLRDVRKGSVRAVSAIRAAYPSRVSVNAERRALQVTARCSGRLVIAHIPLTAVQLAEAVAN